MIVAGALGGESMSGRQSMFGQSREALRQRVPGLPSRALRLHVSSPSSMDAGFVPLHEVFAREILRLTAEQSRLLAGIVEGARAE